MMAMVCSFFDRLDRKPILYSEAPNPSQYYVDELEYEDWPSADDETTGQATISPRRAFPSSFIGRQNSRGFPDVIL